MAAPASAPVRHLTTAQLADRWHASPNAIRIRRSRGNAPKSIKPGKERLYPIAEVEAFERRQLA